MLKLIGDNRIKAILRENITKIAVLIEKNITLEEAEEEYDETMNEQGGPEFLEAMVKAVKDVFYESVNEFAHDL